MDAKTKINLYRERLDKTLACSDLTDENIIRTNVQSRLLQSPEYGTKENIGILLERRTNELVDFLGMLRSASLTEGLNSCPSGSPSADWKVKQDTEECRVMYREGPPGTPFHVLLVEGYLDGPVDTCLCVTWETALYKKWWPQFNYPAFKVTSSQCVHEIGIGEKICTVRMKVPWPLSAREALLHYYEFEFFQEDLVVVIMKTVEDVEGEGCLYGITNDLIHEPNNAVRIGLVGGLAIQKVNDERCYFRFIASLDMKLDFVSPSLINFIARQLIGNGFKLCQKAVASISKGNKDFSEALEGPMYNRIRLAGHFPKSISVLEPEMVKADEGNSLENKGNDPLKSPDDKSSDIDLDGASEIAEDDNNARPSQFPAFNIVKSCMQTYGKTMNLRPEVAHALSTLDRVTEVVRELRKDESVFSNARERGLKAIWHKPLETDTYELRSTSGDIKSDGVAETSMFTSISTKPHQEASLRSSAGEITARSILPENITDNIAIAGSTSKVNKGIYESGIENAKVGRHKNPKASCLRWPCNPRRR